MKTARLIGLKKKRDEKQDYFLSGLMEMITCDMSVFLLIGLVLAFYGG